MWHKKKSVKKKNPLKIFSKQCIVVLFYLHCILLCLCAKIPRKTLHQNKQINMIGTLIETAEVTYIFSLIPVYEHMAFWRVDPAPLAATACCPFPRRPVATLGKSANGFYHVATLLSILGATRRDRVAGVVLRRRRPGTSLTAGGCCCGETGPWPHHGESAGVFQFPHFPVQKDV